MEACTKKEELRAELMVQPRWRVVEAAKAKRETETINDMIFTSPLDTCLITWRSPTTSERMPKLLRARELNMMCFGHLYQIQQ